MFRRSLNLFALFFFLSSLSLSAGVDILLQEAQPLETLEKLLNSYQKKDSIRTNILNDLGWAYRNSNPKLAETYLSEGLKIADSLNIKGSKISISNRIGVVYRNQGDLVKAAYYYNQAINLAEANGYELEVAYANLNMANIFLLEKDYFKAITHASRGLNYFKKQNEIAGMGYGYSLMGESYLKLGNYRQAIEFLKESYAIRERSGDIERLATSAMLLGIAYYETKDWADSEKHLLQALRIQERFDNFQAQGLVLTNLGILEIKRGNLNKAEEYLTSAITYGSDGNINLWELDAFRNLAQVYHGKRDYLNAYKSMATTDSIRSVLNREEKRKEMERLIQSFELNNAERENQLLLKEQLLQRNLLAQQGQKIYILLLIAGTLIILGGLLISNRLKIRKKNALLEDTNNSLEATQLELLEQKKKLQKQSEEINRKNFELIELNQEKDSLMGVVAHDLKTPLANIDGLGYLIRDSGIINKEQNEYLELIQKVSKDGIKLINDLLVLNKLEGGTYEQKFEKIEVAQLCRSLLKTHQPLAADKNIKIELIEDYHNKGIIQTDESSLRRILENLISNAIKFSAPFTAVVLEVKEEPFFFEFSVKDQGPGIKEDERQFLFKKFHRLSNKPTGGESSTGLGLSIVKGLIMQLKGEISVETEVGQGSTFKVVLPK
jgi:signal transduction histidine kinase